MKKTVVIGAICFLGGAMACVIFGSLFGFITWHWRSDKEQSPEEVVREASTIFLVQKSGSQYHLKRLIWSETPATPFSAAPFDALRLKKSEASLPSEIEILVFRMPTPKDWDYLLPMQWEIPLEEGRVRSWNLSLDAILSLVQKTKKANQSAEPTSGLAPGRGSP